MEELRKLIKERILKQGKITFADFMESALYTPGLGYYASLRERVGANGDFYTSPTTHPIFGALLSLQLEQMWRILGCPSAFTVLEMGAGKGLLARDILAYLPQLSPEFAVSLRYVTLERACSSVVYGDTAKTGEKITGCVISNELLDALPVHRVLMLDGRLQEIYVTTRGDQFIETIDTLSTPKLAEYLTRIGISLPDDYGTEINLNIEPWLEEVADKLERGFVLTIDYGYTASELYGSERSRGTLMTYYRHSCGTDPYTRIGEQDITSHVDFTTAILYGQNRKLDFISLLDQRNFLLNLGLDYFIQRLANKKLSHAEYLANRFAMLELVKPEGMGDFKVLLQSKGIAKASLYGTMPENQLKAILKAGKNQSIPLLDKAHIPAFLAKYPQYLSFNEDIW